MTFPLNNIMEYLLIVTVRHWLIDWWASGGNTGTPRYTSGATVEADDLKVA